MLASNIDLEFDWVKVVWNKYVPSKIAFFHWLAIHGGVPVKEVLHSRHCLPNGLDVTPSSILEFSYDWSNGMGIKASRFWSLIGPASIWAIWIARNDALFNGIYTCWAGVIKCIKFKVFQWLVNAKICESYQFYSWESQPWLLI
ncbi:uncharacterized protein [Rutidosis leptorrhynchoides]|uniref:uncharacterized protein n=1 Tax=Rutidosis leptorrhynchoides TaxID=125765 RepID=UPI003A99A7A3